MNGSGALTMLGFASKAGKVVSGETGSRAALLKNRGKLMILSDDAAQSTVTEFVSLAEKKKVPVIRFARMDELGRAIGKSNRSILVILDKGFAEQIVRKVEE